MTYHLSPEHESFRQVVREFAEAEIAPHAAKWDRDHHFPIDVVHQMGDLGLFGLTAPAEFGGAGEDGDFTSLCVAIEEIGRVDQSMGITLEAAVGLGINPIQTYGTAEQQQTWLPDLVAGRTPRRLRTDRARLGLRRGRHQDPRRARRRRVGRQRLQAVHHQLRLRHHLARHRHRAHRRASGRPPRDLHDHRPDRHARLRRRARLRQARLARQRHAPAELRRRTRARGEPAR